MEKITKASTVTAAEGKLSLEKSAAPPKMLSGAQHHTLVCRFNKLKRVWVTPVCRHNLFTLTAICIIIFIITLMQGSIQVPSILSLRSFDRFETNKNSALWATFVLDHRDTSRPAFFFVETSSSGLVTSRQACAVESAALLHPEADVYLLLLSPPINIDVMRNPSLRQLNENYPNVQVLSFRPQDYLKGGPLEKWYTQLTLHNSNVFTAADYSDIIRYYTMWKYGGTYLDLDVVLMRSFKDLKNFSGAVSESIVACGVMNMERKSFVPSECINDIPKSFQPNTWGSIGPCILTRVLQRLCGTNDTREMKRERCQGLFEAKPSNYFYPIFWKTWQPYFEEANADKTMKLISDSFAIHVWNKFSVNRPIRIGSKQPYGTVAEKFCPNVFSGSGPYF